MKDIKLYITEKFRISDDIKVKKDIDYSIPYLIVHYLFIINELRIYVENTCWIKEVKDNNIMIIEPLGWRSVVKKPYIIKDNRIYLTTVEDIDEYTRDLPLLLPKEEAIEFLKSLKDNDYTIDLKEYFGYKNTKRVAVREDNTERKINDEEIKSHIEELENAKN